MHNITARILSIRDLYPMLRWHKTNTRTRTRIISFIKSIAYHSDWSLHRREHAESILTTAHHLGCSWGNYNLYHVAGRSEWNSEIDDCENGGRRLLHDNIRNATNITFPAGKFPLISSHTSLLLSFVGEKWWTLETNISINSGWMCPTGSKWQDSLSFLWRDSLPYPSPWSHIPTVHIHF